MFRSRVRPGRGRTEGRGDARARRPASRRLRRSRSRTSTSRAVPALGRRTWPGTTAASIAGRGGSHRPRQGAVVPLLLLHHDRHPRHPHHRGHRVHPVAGVGGVARHDPAGELLHGRGGQPVLALGGRDLAVPDAAAVPGRCRVLRRRWALGSRSAWVDDRCDVLRADMED